MNTEKLIAKGVKKHFNGQVVLFNVESLKEHFDGLQIHDTDVISILDSEDEQLVEYIKAVDVNFDNSVAKDVAITEEVFEVVADVEIVTDDASGELPLD
jgi:hypothetical protein